MSGVGKEVRLAQILGKDGKVLVIPHESIRPPHHWDVAAKAVIAGGADILMTTPGLLMTFYKAVAGKIPLVATIPDDPLYVDLAAKMGFLGVKTTYFGPLMQLPRDAMMKVSIRCAELGMVWYPEIVPMTAPRDQKGERIFDPKVLISVCNIAASLGADLVKTEYSGSTETYKEVCKESPLPVTVLGGERISDEECLKRIKGAMDAGAIGGAFSRNTVTHPNPEKIVRAIQKIIHKGASVTEAAKELK